MATRIETVRRLEAAMRDYDVEEALACLADEAEILPLRAQLEGKSYRGAEGLRAMIADLSEDWEYIDQHLEEIRERGDALVGVGRMRARSNTTGIDLDVPVAWLLRFEGELIVYGRAYSEPAEALRAAGIEEG